MFVYIVFLCFCTGMSGCLKTIIAHFYSKQNRMKHSKIKQRKFQINEFLDIKIHSVDTSLETSSCFVWCFFLNDKCMTAVHGHIRQGKKNTPGLLAKASV